MTVLLKSTLSRPVLLGLNVSIFMNLSVARGSGRVPFVFRLLIFKRRRRTSFPAFLTFLCVVPRRRKLSEPGNSSVKWRLRPFIVLKKFRRRVTVLRRRFAVLLFVLMKPRRRFLFVFVIVKLLSNIWSITLRKLKRKIILIVKFVLQKKFAPGGSFLFRALSL